MFDACTPAGYARRGQRIIRDLPRVVMMTASARFTVHWTRAIAVRNAHIYSVQKRTHDLLKSICTICAFIHSYTHAHHIQTIARVQRKIQISVVFFGFSGGAGQREHCDSSLRVREYLLLIERVCVRGGLVNYYKVVWFTTEYISQQSEAIYNGTILRSQPCEFCTPNTTRPIIYHRVARVCMYLPTIHSAYTVIYTYGWIRTCD